MKNSLKAIISAGKIIAAIIALGLVVFACILFTAAYELNKSTNEAIVAEPLRVKIDLSKTGTYSHPLNLSAVNSHGEYIFIENSITKTRDHILSVLKGLKGSLVIKDLQEQTVFEVDLSDDEEQRRTPELIGNYPGWYYSMPGTGQYKLKLTIIEPAKTLEGAEQSLVIRNWFCGCIKLAVLQVYGIGGVLFIVGLITLIIVIKKRFF